MLLTRQQIKEKDDLALEKVDVPEWGGHVFIRRLTSLEAGALMVAAGKMQEAKDEREQGKFHILMAAKTICDESGAAMFDDDEGREILAGKSQIAIGRLARVSMKLNPLTDKNVDDAVKNSEEAPAASSTALPSDSAEASPNSSPQ